MIHDGTTDFFSDHEVSYSAKGVTKETTTFVLREPGMDHFKHYMRIKQMFMQVFQEINEKRKGNEPEDISGEEIAAFEEDHEQNSEEFAAVLEMLLLTSEKIGVPDFVEAFRTMACMRTSASKPIVMLDGEQAMTDAIWMNMHPDDAYKMAVRWAAFFAMPSAGGPKTSLSKPSSSVSRAVVV